MPTDSIDTVFGKFLDWINVHPSGVFLFRGQADRSAIKPKVGRPAYNFDRARERATFHAFERAARPFLRGSMTPFELLALAQHHGAPTRLADWSTTPLVAAWFAVSSFPEITDAQIYALEVLRNDIDTVDANTGKTGNGSSIEHPLDPIKGIFLLETAQVSTRITTQRGIFTLHGDPCAALTIPDTEIFTVPAVLRNEFQSRLMDLGIDASHIYPDIDGLCRSLDWRLKSNKNLSAFA